jgi:hypothetical protein
MADFPTLRLFVEEPPLYRARFIKCFPLAYVIFDTVLKEARVSPGRKTLFHLDPNFT